MAKKKSYYKRKKHKQPLQEYLAEYGIELEPNEKQIIIDGKPINYVATRSGDIISYHKNCKEPKKLVPVLLWRYDKDGNRRDLDESKVYRAVNLFVSDGKEKMFLLHRLIASTFIPNPENKPEVNHINGDKGNNSVENLEWVTSKENSLEALRLGLLIPRKGSKHHAAKINEEIAYEIAVLLLYSEFSMPMIAKLTKSTSVIVRKINKGERWLHVTKDMGFNFPLMSHRKNNLKCSTTREKDIVKKYNNMN